ncbi:MAG: beta-galactosidase [Promethearchaeota archaeon]
MNFANYPEDLIRIEGGYYFFKNIKIPLLSGEFHFWRNNKRFWNRILDSLKDLGFKHLTTYVEWNFHRIKSASESSSGVEEFDFWGKTDQQTNLEGYLSLLEKRGDFWLSIRPGPYIYAETEFGGPPFEAVKYHRNHPRFLEMAENYIKNVCKVLKPHLITNGGRIIMCQLDNEVSMIKHQSQVLNLPLEDPCSFRAFIKERYGSWEEAAKLYGLEDEWEGWEDVAPMTAMPLNEREFLLYIDTARYLEWYNMKFFKKIAEFYMKYGINVPFYINSTGPPFPHDPELLDDFIALRTADIYYLKKDKLIDMLTFNAKLLESNSPAVVAGEFRCGTFSGFQMNSDLYKYQALLWMGYGFHGVNYFMLVERHRWPNTPIDAVGRPYIAYDTMKKIVNAYNKVDFPRFTNYDLSDIQLMWYRPHGFADKAAALEPGYDLKEDYNFNYIFKNLVRDNIPFKIWYPTSSLKNSKYSKLDANKYPILIYAGHNFFEEKYAREILEYIRAGGTTIFYGNFPTKDINGEEMNIFSDFLINPCGAYRLSANGNRGNCGINFGYSSFSTDTSFLLDYNIPKSEDLSIFKYKHMNVGYIKRLGKGRAVVLGFDLNKSNLKSVLGILGWKPPFQVDKNGVLSNLYVIKGTNNGNNKENIEILAFLINTNETMATQCTLSLNLNKLNISNIATSEHDKNCNWKIEYLFEGKSKEVFSISRLSENLRPMGGKMLYIHK